MLPFTMTRTVHANHRITIELPDVEPGTLVTVLVVPANVTTPAIDAHAARRKANGWLIDHVGHLVTGKDPRMVLDGKRAWWRVAAVYLLDPAGEPGILTVSSGDFVLAWEDWMDGRCVVITRAG